MYTFFSSSPYVQTISAYLIPLSCTYSSNYHISFLPYHFIFNQPTPHNVLQQFCSKKLNIFKFSPEAHTLHPYSTDRTNILAYISIFALEDKASLFTYSMCLRPLPLTYPIAHFCSHGSLHCNIHSQVPKALHFLQVQFKCTLQISCPFSLLNLITLLLITITLNFLLSHNLPNSETNFYNLTRICHQQTGTDSPPCP